MEEKPNLKAMPAKTKVQYIWDYYRFHILITIGVIAFVVYIIYSAVTYVEPVLNVIMLNCASGYSTSTDAASFDEFLEEYGYEGDSNDLVSLSTTLVVTEESGYSSYEDQEVLMAMIAAGDQDLFFATGDLFLDYAEQGAFLDLSTILSEETLEKYADDLIYSTDEGETESYPCAIRLVDNKWVTESGYYTSECYFGIFARNENQETAVQFAEYLLNYE